MTTTDEFTPVSPPPPPPEGSGGQRTLRRSRTNRVAAGVSGGLGEYFNVDPVLFRVLFATSAFFGGAGILAYLVAWAAIPEEGTADAPIDRLVRELRRRRVPVWAVVIVVGLVLWILAFSWWAPGPFFPVMIALIILIALFARRGPVGDGPPEPVSLEKGAAAPAWTGETRSWMSEARQASRERRRRAFPVRIGAVAALVLSLGPLGIVDAATGIALPVYFWVTLGIVVLALLVGMVLRRTPWSLAILLIPALAGIVAFGGTDASLHDGFGERAWKPTDSLASEYRLAFGQGVLDLSELAPLDGPRTVDVTMAAGNLRVILPPTLNATVDANVHIGQIELDGRALASTGPRYRHEDGWNVQRVIEPDDSATGQPLTINLHLADGLISIDHD